MEARHTQKTAEFLLKIEFVCAIRSCLGRCCSKHDGHDAVPCVVRFVPFRVVPRCWTSVVVWLSYCARTLYLFLATFSHLAKKRLKIETAKSADSHRECSVNSVVTDIISIWKAGVSWLWVSLACHCMANVAYGYRQHNALAVCFCTYASVWCLFGPFQRCCACRAFFLLRRIYANNDRYNVILIVSRIKGEWRSEHRAPECEEDVEFRCDLDNSKS